MNEHTRLHYLNLCWVDGAQRFHLNLYLTGQKRNANSHLCLLSRTVGFTKPIKMWLTISSKASHSIDKMTKINNNKNFSTVNISACVGFLLMISGSSCNAGQSFHHFGPNWNILTITGLNAVKFNYLFMVLRGITLLTISFRYIITTCVHSGSDQSASSEEPGCCLPG